MHIWIVKLNFANTGKVEQGIGALQFFPPRIPSEDQMYPDDNVRDEVFRENRFGEVRNVDVLAFLHVDDSRTAQFSSKISK